MFDEQIKEALLKRLPHPVVVCGCVGEDEVANAFTLTWITQTSFDPPVIAIAVQRDSASSEMLRQSNVFSISFLGVTQLPIAEHFMQSRAENPAKLDAYPSHDGVTGCPILDDAQGAIECNVIHIVEHGDHDVVVGEIIATEGSSPMEEQLLLSHTTWQYAG